MERPHIYHITGVSIHAKGTKLNDKRHPECNDDSVSKNESSQSDKNNVNLV